MTSDSTSRQPHVILDLPSRIWKARKIERLLGLELRQGPMRLLEIGSGSGGIAHYFGTHPSGKYTVDAVDVGDHRQISEGYRFSQVDGTRLPFEDRTFDIVITNHVIEHVGGKADQIDHLMELRRVLSPEGMAFLAVPSRWMLVEPHYQLRFLSWLPESWRTPYLRAARKGLQYDCRPLHTRELEAMLDTCHFEYRNLNVEGLRATFEIERPASDEAKLLRCIPDWMIRPLRRLIPTLIYRLTHPARS